MSARVATRRYFEGSSRNARRRRPRSAPWAGGSPRGAAGKSSGSSVSFRAWRRCSRAAVVAMRRAQARRSPAAGSEPPACPINAPKRLHGQILGGAAVANDAHGPGIDLLLVLAKESLKGFEVARRESFEQLHRPHSIRTYCQGGCEVTASFEWSEYTGESVQKNGATGDGLHWSRSFRTGSILKKGGECALAGVWHTPLK